MAKYREEGRNKEKQSSRQKQYRNVKSRELGLKRKLEENDTEDEDEEEQGTSNLAICKNCGLMVEFREICKICKQFYHNSPPCTQMYLGNHICNLCFISSRNS